MKTNIRTFEKIGIYLALKSKNQMSFQIKEQDKKYDVCIVGSGAGGGA